MSRHASLVWRGGSHQTNRARKWHQRCLLPLNASYRVNLLGVIRNPHHKPLLHKGRKP